MQEYKIINFNRDTGSIVVEFNPEMSPISIDLPIGDDNKYITGVALDEHIRGFIPTWFIERKAKIAMGISNEAEIAALVQEPTPNPTASVTPAQNDLDAMNEAGRAFVEYETERAIAKALLKWGILTQDPTAIQSTTL